MGKCLIVNIFKKIYKHKIQNTIMAFLELNSTGSYFVLFGFLAFLIVIIYVIWIKMKK